MCSKASAKALDNACTDAFVRIPELGHRQCMAQCGMVQHNNGFYHAMQLPLKRPGAIALLPRHL
jgi:hypothetical protein